MSWNITLIGKPANIVQALEDESQKMEGQSKVEFDSVKDHIAGIVAQNFETTIEQPLLKVTASGHGYAVEGEQKQRTAVVNIEALYGKVV